MVFLMVTFQRERSQCGRYVIEWFINGDAWETEAWHVPAPRVFADTQAATSLGIFCTNADGDAGAQARAACDRHQLTHR